MQNTAAADDTEKTKGAAPAIFGIDIRFFGVAMIIFSFLGYRVKNISRMVTKHIFDSRHQLLPFLFAYGIALLAIYTVMGTPGELRFFGRRVFRTKSRRNTVLSHVIYFFVICAFIMLGEIAVGTIYEKFAGVILWDYTDIPTHITRYTSLITTALIGGGVYAIMAFGFRPMMNLVSKMGTRAAAVVDCTPGAAIVLDFLIMIIVTFVTGSAPEYWSIHF